MPVYNEQSYLTRIVGRVLAAPVPNDMKKELVIVNDASTDRTAEVIRDLCANHHEIKAFDQPVNMGNSANSAEQISVAVTCKRAGLEKRVVPQ